MNSKIIIYFISILPIISFLTNPVQASANITINSVFSEEKNVHDLVTTKATNLTFGDEDYTLLPAISGLRKKKVFALVHVKFYFAELLAAQPQKLIKTDSEILASLTAAQPLEMKLTLLRDVPNNQIIDYFTEALKANQITELNASPSIKLFFEELKNLKQLNKNDVFSFIGLWKKDKTILILQFPDKTTKMIEGDLQFLNQIYSIWLGEPADDKVKALKKEFFKN